MKVYFAHSFEDETSNGMICHNDDRIMVEVLRELLKDSFSICDPAETSIPEEEFSDRFRFCIEQIQQSDVLVVNATKRLGIGVGAEMMFACNKNIPVFTICPHSTYYRRLVKIDVEGKEWIHPFIKGLSTKIFDSAEQCSIELLSLREKGELNVSRRI